MRSVIHLLVFCSLSAFSMGCSSATSVTKSESRQATIDSTFQFYKRLGFNNNDRLKYIYHFNDRADVPIEELAKALEKDSIEVIGIDFHDRKWFVSAFENRIHSAQSIAEQEKRFRWMMYKFKVDNYLGFTIAEADIPIESVPADQFYSFILDLPDEDLFNVAMRLDKVKAYEKSLVTFDELIKRYFKLDTSYYKMGTALVATHEYVDGIERWEKAISLNPDYFDAHMDAGLLFFENSHWKKAHLHFKEADRIKPNDDVILYNLAKSLIKLERYNEAYATIQRAVKLNPKNVHAKGVLDNLKSPAIRKLRKANPNH